ncbi:TonB-dependent receptor [Woeseia oceani]|uniref:TonB-dependent receptor n=2 Tax=Woeseia oceani TaxID=1548547 RepID=A0A193LL70_9GAMM|nr:TonB-dependent receptor [Woeseia oceani]
MLMILTVSVPRALAQTQSEQDDAEDEVLDEVTVTGTQIKGAAISDALAVSVFGQQDVEAMGISSGDELLDYIPEQGQNFQTEAESEAGGINSVRGDIGAFNLRNMGTGNTLVLLNGRRMVQAAGYQTELVGGSFVPVNTVNSNAIPTMGIERVEVLRDGASAIYGADAVAGVVNTVLQTDYDGLTIGARLDSYENIPRDDQRVNIKWGHDFNQGRSNISVFADYYHRDRVRAQDDPRWANADQRWLLDEDNPWASLTSFRNDSINSGFGQFDAEDSRTGGNADPAGFTDSGGEFEVVPMSDSYCQHADAWQINEAVCGLPDGVYTHDDGRVGNVRYNLNEDRDLASELDRYNVFATFNHEFDSGTEAYTELSWYSAKTHSTRSPASTSTGVEFVIPADNYYNPFGPCGSDNRVVPDDDPDVPCEGVPLIEDYYRFVEVPRIVDNDNTTWRFLQGFRGAWQDWDWDTALVWSRAERNDNNHNRVSYTLLQEALEDTTPAAYNPFHGNVLPSNIERALVTVYRKNKTDLKMVDFKMTNAELFDLPAGPVGILLGAEYREESFVDDRDDRLDGTIQFTDVDGDTFPYVSDVAQSSPSSDSSGKRGVTSLFMEMAVPVFESLDLQAAVRYEDLSDVGDTTVGKLSFGWRPIDQLLFRGSWSEAFRAPNLITVNEGLVVRINSRTNYVCQYAVDTWEAAHEGQPDFDAAQEELNCFTGTQRQAQGAENLIPEKSTNTSAGFVWQPTNNLTLTVDFWSIKKKDTIGLFGETNHSLLDALLRIENGLNSCDTFGGNTAVGYLDVDAEDIPFYTAAGICPAGEMATINDIYANLDNRTVEGHDIGLFYGMDSAFGSWDLSLRGTFYDKYEQSAGPATQELIDASAAGVFPETFTTPTGFGDLLRQDGNQETKFNARLSWSKDAMAARVSAYYLSDFYQSSLGTQDGQEWVIPSMTTYNTSFDYRTDLFGTNTRFRFGINNLTNERAPLADRYFGYFADAHRDYGRYYYVDVRMTL